ncbi:MAG TPA: HD domain-containing phosphohydrolase [Gallionellaceae bacterium]|nr:HD domain-containing phosphohydrolase [Gallionellaceae bacterium]
MLKLTPGQFEYIVSQTRQGVFGQFLAVVLVSPVLMRLGFPGPNMYLWDTCATVLLAYRYLSFRRLLPSRNVGAPLLRSSVYRYVIPLFLMGLLWAVLFAKIVQQPSPEVHFLGMVFGMGLASAAVVTLGPAFGIYAAFSGPMLVTLVVAFLLRGDELHVTAALFLAVGIVFAFYTAYKYSEHFRIMQEMTEQVRETEIEALVCLGKAGEYRDSDTGDHVLRVGYSAYVLARAAGLSEADAKNLMYAAPLHDVGKIGIADAILLKPEKLTEAEVEAMKKHTRIGAEILKNSRSRIMRTAKTVALNHHERWDGTGYPNGLAGDSIPIEGRIVAICDVFDALVSSRPYKMRWSDTEAIDFLRRNAGTHFDPTLVELFINEIPRVKEFCLRLDVHESATGLHPLVQLT